MRTLILLVVLTAGVVVQSEPAGSLAAARDLYVSADYEGALEMLEHLATTDVSPQDRQSIDLYRTLCLIALDRREEASQAIVAMTGRDPLFRPADGDVPPRLRSLFSETRRMVLPGVIQSRYERAKDAFDRHDYTTAAELFAQVLIALSDPDIAREASRTPLADIRVLAIGYKDLAVRAMTIPAAPIAAPPTPVADAPRVEAPKVPRIFDSYDADVVPPIVVKQEIPRFQRPVLVERTGVLFIVVDENGGVESAIITEPIERTYDRMVLTAAKSWTYQPALRSGVPVKYRKRIQLTLPRQTN